MDTGIRWSSAAAVLAFLIFSSRMLGAEVEGGGKGASVKVTFEELAQAPEKYDGKLVRIAAFVKTGIYGGTWLFQRWIDAREMNLDKALGRSLSVKSQSFQLAPTPPMLPLRADVVGKFKMIPNGKLSKITPGLLEQIDELKIYYLSDDEMNDANLEVK